MDSTTPKKTLSDLVAVMAALRTPGSGCPWDLEQSFRTIAPYTIEEAYEVADAIERGDHIDLCDELGDLLFQVVYHARLAEEEDTFAIDDVIDGITRKMVRRHPHVFGDQAGRITAPEDVNGLWERIKAEEREAKARARQAAGIDSDRPQSNPSAMDDVPTGLPALKRADKLQKRAARHGFDWPDLGPVLAKIDEELHELRVAADGGDPDAVEDELGDVLFAVANAARHLSVDAESALRRTNAKFVHRWRAMEAAAASDGHALDDLSLEQQERLWQQAKTEEGGT